MSDHVVVTASADTKAIQEALTRTQAELMALRRDRALAPVVDALTAELVAHFAREHRVLRRALRSVRGAFSEASQREVERLLAELAAAQAAAATRTVRRIARQLARALRLGHSHAAQRLVLSVALQVPQPRAVAWLERHAAQLVKGIDETTRSRVASIVTQAVEEGWSYAKTEQALKDLYEGFRKSLPQQHIHSRARLIAVNEAAMGYTQGELELGRWLAEGGLAVEKSWLTVGDERTCEDCSGNEGEGWIALEDSFGDGSEGPPSHPACRCVLEMQLAEDPIARAAA